jgi:hypothetical protein
MEIYSPRKNYNALFIMNELKPERVELNLNNSGRIIKAGSGVQRRDKTVDLMRRKLVDRIKVFFDDED